MGSLQNHRLRDLPGYHNDPSRLQSHSRSGWSASEHMVPRNHDLLDRFASRSSVRPNSLRESSWQSDQLGHDAQQGSPLLQNRMSEGFLKSDNNLLPESFMPRQPKFGARDFELGRIQPDSVMDRRSSSDRLAFDHDEQADTFMPRQPQLQDFSRQEHPQQEPALRRPERSISALSHLPTRDRSSRLASIREKLTARRQMHSRPGDLAAGIEAQGQRRPYPDPRQPHLFEGGHQNFDSRFQLPHERPHSDFEIRYTSPLLDQEQPAPAPVGWVGCLYYFS